MTIARYLNGLVLAAILGTTIIAPATALAATSKKYSKRKAKKTTLVKKTAPVAAAALTDGTPTRGMWVWSDADNIVESQSQQETFFNFVKAPHGNPNARINRVFLSGDEFDYTSSSEKTKLRAFLKRAHAEGLKVEFLAGSSKWARTSEMSNAYKRVDRMIAFNKGSSNAAERFDGIHFDIEPHTLSEWRKSPRGADGYNDTLEKNYITILRKSREKIKASGQDLTISVDIPTWFLNKATDITKPLMAADTPVSYITIMNYFDTESTFLYGYNGSNSSGGIGPNLALSSVPLMFGANIKPVSSEPETTTFQEEGVAAMEKVVVAANAKFGNNARYMGVAVHHYGEYRAMPSPPAPIIAAPTPAPTPTTQPIPVVEPIPTTPVPAPVVTTPAPTPVPEPIPVVSPVTASTVAANSRAMWVWSSADDIVKYPAEQDTFFAFIKAPHGDASARINRIFWSSDSIDYTNATQAAQMRAFLKRAHAEGVAVEFLTGNSAWARTELMGEPLKRADRMNAFNKGSSNAAERFDGMHLDIEPYLLDEWKSGSLGTDGYNDTLEQNYLSVLNQVRAKLDAAGHGSTLSVDVPTWFSSNATEIWNPLTASNSPVDYVTIMNYFDTAATFMYGYGGANKSGGIGPNLARSSARPIMFGAETKADVDPISITFAQEGLSAMESVFDKSYATFSGNSKYAGLAVHHYEVYRFMK